jgi:hypothetical protein
VGTASCACAMISPLPKLLGFLACALSTILKSGNGVGRYVAAIMGGGSAQLCHKIALHDELIKIGVDGGRGT